MLTVEQMKQMKRDRGYTLVQLSEWSGVPLGTIQKIFSGETDHPRFTTLQALEKAFSGETKSVFRYEELAGGSPPEVREDPAAYDPGKRQGSLPEPSSYREFLSPGQWPHQGTYTVEDYYSAPERFRTELIDGIFYDLSAPGFLHQQLLIEMAYQVKDYIKKKDGPCRVSIAPTDVKFPDDDRTVVQPDLLIICDRHRITEHRVDGAPDFVLEILSPSTRQKDLSIKLTKYSQRGVREYWILDPKYEKLIIYNLQDDDIEVEMLPLEGRRGVMIYNGDLEIDLEELDRIIREMRE